MSADLAPGFEKLIPADETSCSVVLVLEYSLPMVIEGILGIWVGVGMVHSEAEYPPKPGANESDEESNESYRESTVSLSHGEG